MRHHPLLLAAAVLLIAAAPAAAGHKDQAAPGAEEAIHLAYTLPPRTAEVCREQVNETRQRYIERIRENPSRESELRREFYRQRVPTIIENCNPPPSLANVSDAPASMPQECKDRLRALNQEIIARTNASVGDTVPDRYRDRYENALKGCVGGAAIQMMATRLQDVLFQGGMRGASVLLDVFTGFIDRAVGIIVNDPSAADDLAIGQADMPGNMTGTTNASRQRSGGLVNGIVDGLASLVS